MARRKRKGTIKHSLLSDFEFAGHGCNECCRLNDREKDTFFLIFNFFINN